MDTTDENESSNSALALVKLRKMCERGGTRRPGALEPQPGGAGGRRPVPPGDARGMETGTRVPRGDQALRYFELLVRLKTEGRVSPLRVA